MFLKMNLQQIMELIKHPHLIATPHMAGQTAEAQKRASVDIAREVLAALKGEKLTLENCLNNGRIMEEKVKETKSLIGRNRKS